MSGYGERKSRAVGLNDKAFGGAGMNLSLDAVMGEGDMITVFDDFNGSVNAEAFSVDGFWQNLGWLLTIDGTATGNRVAMNDYAGAYDFDSSIRIQPGTDEDEGGNMQLDTRNADSPTIGGHVFPHIPMAGSATNATINTTSAEAMDNSVFVFACRIGLKADENSASTNWDSSAFIGYAQAGDTSILTAADGFITINSGGPLAGFHILKDGSIRGICHRTVSTAMTAGTNFTELVAAGGVDSTVANGARTAGDVMWFDLAFRMEVSDQSATTNGSTKFYYRGPTNSTTTTGGGQNQFEEPGAGYKPWIEHPTALLNQVPNGSPVSVPTIEVINGSTADIDCVVFVDWWAMGRSRIGT